MRRGRKGWDKVKVYAIVEAMCREGYGQAVIAYRLGCSKSYVTKVMADLRAKKTRGVKPDPLPPIDPVELLAA